MSFTDASRSVSVCLQCQIRLARRSSIHGGVRILPPSRSRARQYSAAAAFAETTDSTDHEIPQQPHDAAEPPSPKSKRRRTLGQSLRGRQVALLNAKRLGKPASVLVLHERDRRRSVQPLVNPDKSDKKPSDTEPTAHDILSEVKQDSAPLSPEIVRANIERFRLSFAKHTKGLREDQWKGLRTRISKGFSSGQIRDYIEEFEKTRVTTRGKALNIEEPSKSDTATGAGTDSFLQHDDEVSSEQGLIDLNRAQKNSLVDYLLMNCWGLENKFQITTANVLLTRPALHVLLKHKGDILGKLSARYNTEIVPNTLNDQLTLTGKTDSINIIRSNISEFTKDIEVMPVVLGGRRGVFPNTEGRKAEASFRESLGRYHGVAILPSECSLEVLIHYLPQNRNSAENARRDILLAQRSEGQQQTGLTWYPDGAYLCPFTSSESLSWLEKRHDWARYMSPSSKRSSPGVDVSKVLHQRNLQKGGPLPFDELQEYLFDKALKERQSNKTEPHERTTVSVQPGQVLLRCRPGLPLVKFDRNHVRKHIKRPRAFVTEFPSIGRFFEYMDTRGSELREKGVENPDVARMDTFRVTLSPVTAGIFPAIEIELKHAKPDFPPAIVRMDALLKERSMDLLLPSCVSDLRFTRQTRLDLIGRYGKKSSSPYASFLQYDAKSWSIDQPLRYSLTPFVHLDIPPSLSQSLLGALSLKSKSNKSQKHKGTGGTAQPSNLDLPTRVEYMVTGVLAVNSVHLEYQGGRLLYEDLRGGRLMGHRKALSLSVDWRKRDLNDLRTLFISACEVVLKLGHVTSPLPEKQVDPKSQKGGRTKRKSSRPTRLGLSGRRKEQRPREAGKGERAADTAK